MLCRLKNEIKVDKRFQIFCIMLFCNFSGFNQRETLAMSDEKIYIYVTYTQLFCFKQIIIYRNYSVCSSEYSVFYFNKLNSHCNYLYMIYMIWFSRSKLNKNIFNKFFFSRKMRFSKKRNCQNPLRVQFRIDEPSDFHQSPHINVF